MEKQISQFTVVRGQTDTLVERVNEMIELGWQPWGDFQHAGIEASDAGYYGQQAMVRYAGRVATGHGADAAAVGNC
jgi:hypothetical protein